MKGTRPLNNDEIRRVSAAFTGMYEVRNRGLFMLGVSTGGRISELLSLRIGDVYQNGTAVTDLLYDKSIVKGGEVSRAVPVNIDGRQAIDSLIEWHREQYQNTEPGFRPLFPSRQKSGTLPMHRQTAHDILKTAFTSAGLNGKLATHSLRKSFAQRVYEQSGDIFLVQELLGHKSVSTTQRYLGVNYADARAAVEGMSIDAESYRSIQTSESFHFLGAELKTTADETLFLELALRGYDLSSLRENDETQPPAGEIVKIS